MEELTVRTRGDHGPAVLWIHGYTMSSAVWEPSWDALPDMRHIGVDLPGHGTSPAMPQLTMPELGEQLASLARRHDVAHVVGLSFGGMIALQVAAAMGEALTTLLVAAAAIGGGPQDPVVQSRNLELFRLYRERGAGPWLRELWMAPPVEIFRGAERHPDLWARLCAIIDAHRWEELGDARMHRLVSHDQLPELKRIRADTVVVIGDDMPAFKRAAELIRRGIRNSRRIHVDAGHLSLLERPEATASIIAEQIFTAATGQTAVRER